MSNTCPIVSPTPAPPHLFYPPNFAYQHTCIVRGNTSPLCFVINTHKRIPFHYSISPIYAGRFIFLLLCTFHNSAAYLSTAITNSLMNMAPKRKATDSGSTSSPLKKRNAVTAGIGRAAESESNGIAFSYYGRTDDREDVSRMFSHFLRHHALFCSSNSHHTTDIFSHCNMLGSLRHHMRILTSYQWLNSRRSRTRMPAHLVVALVSLSVVKGVGGLSIIHAGIPLTVKKTFLRAISIVINAAIVATYHRTQHRLAPWADFLVTFSRQIQ